jgi:hypothetical protein
MSAFQRLSRWVSLAALRRTRFGPNACSTCSVDSCELDEGPSSRSLARKRPRSGPSSPSGPPARAQIIRLGTGPVSLGFRACFAVDQDVFRPGSGRDADRDALIFP